MTLLLDTNIISFMLKGDSRFQLYRPLLQGHVCALSFMSVAELYQWGAIYQWGEARYDTLRQVLSNYVILPWELEMCPLWGQIRAQVRQQGLAISGEDAWIATTAVYYNL